VRRAPPALDAYLGAGDAAANADALGRLIGRWPNATAWRV
jgi:hypothetical protein